MIDYYDALSLDRSQSVDDINHALNKQESVWKKRRTTAPDKAVKMLALIVDAREAFRSAASKAEYDQALDASNQPREEQDAGSNRKEQFKRWEKEARGYLSSSQYDLAKTAFEKALSFSEADFESASFYGLAAEIYSNVNQDELALEYVNKAIIEDSKNALYDVRKAVILLNLSCKKYSRTADEHIYKQKARDSAERAVEKAAETGNGEALGIAYGFLAVLYHDYLRTTTQDKAEDYAQKAVDAGDAWGNGRRVLNEIRSARKAEEIAEERRKRDAEAAAKQRAIDNELAEKHRIEAEEAARKRKSRESRSRALQRVGSSGLPVFFVCVAVVLGYFFTARPFDESIPNVVLGLGIVWFCFAFTASHGGSGFVSVALGLLIAFLYVLILSKTLADPTSLLIGYAIGSVCSALVGFVLHKTCN